MKLTLNRFAVFTLLLSTAAAASAQVAVSTTASSSTVAATGLGSTAGLAVDQTGNVLAIDGVNNQLVQLVGGNAAPTSILTGLTSPAQVAIDSSRNVYIANGTSNQVLEIPYQAGALNLNATILLGNGLGTVVGVAVDLSGNVYAVDATNKQVVRILGATQTTVASGLTAPKQITVDRNGNAYVADSGAGNIVIISPAGAASVYATGLNAPTGVATDISSNLYVTEAGSGQLDEIPYGGVETTLLTGLVSPGALALDTRGTAYIASGGSVLRYSFGTAIYFGLLPVGTASQTFPINISFVSAINPSAIKVVTTGITGLDFKDAGNDTCAVNGNYAVGATCTVNVTFTPGSTGPRYGAIVMYGSNNAVLGRIFLGGGGLGALLTVDPGTISTITPTGILNAGTYTTLTTPRGLTVDAGGNIFLAEDGYTSGATAFPSRITELPAAQSITAYSISSTGVVTFTCNNSYVAGENITTSGFPKSTFLNSQILPVLSSGLSSTQFEVQLSSASYDGMSATETGVAQTPATVIAVTGTNNVAINGAGDLIVATGSATIGLLPYENGTWNLTDLVTIGTGYQRARTARPDVAGNVWWCDGNSDTMWEYQWNTATTLQLPYTKYAAACLSTAVDLYGNLAYSDGTNGKVLYVPISGVTPYETGSGLTSAWGIAFDTSGSAWVSSSAANILARIPNENGVLVGGDQTLSTVGNVKNFDIWLDGSGTLYTTQDSGNQVSSFSIINRAATSDVFGSSTVTTTIGNSSSTTLNGILTNSGNTAPIYSNGGTIGLYDIDDFPEKIPAAGNECGFAVPLVPGFSCNLAFGFSPTSSGTRTGTFEFSSNALVNGAVNFTGYASGTVAGTVTFAVNLSTPSTGSPSPGQALVVAAAASPSASTAPTGAVTFYVDGKATGKSELASSAASFGIPAGLALGAHVIGITYAGDGNYAPIATQVTASITVVLATSSVALVSSAAEVAAGQSIVFSATVPQLTGLAVPTGTVTFLDGTATIGTGALNGGGVAVFSTTTLATGTHSICASYGGDNVYAGSKSTCSTVIIGTYAATTTALTTKPSGSYTFGQAIAAAVSVTPTSGTGTPTGAVAFELDGAPTVVTLAAGKASISLTSVGAGNHTLTCFYSGDTTYAASACVPAAFTVVKAITATTLATSTTADFASQNVTLTATVSSSTSTPTGSVAFYSGPSVVGNATLVAGVAVYTTGLLPAGADSITAVYQGDANNSTSASKPIVITVTLVPSTITITAAPSVVISGTTTTLTATLTAPITANFSGTVNFYSVSGTTSTLVGSATVSATGVGSFTTSALTAATSTFTATYSGSAVFTSSSTSASAVVYVTNAGGTGVVATTSLGSNLSSAVGVTTDNSGNVYINDSTKAQIDLLTGGGLAQSVAISGLSTAAGLAVDGSGDLFIANGASNQVTEFVAQNGVLTTGSSKQFGSGLGTLVGVALDPSNNIYVTDSTNLQVVKISGGVQTVLLTSAKVTNPQQVAVDHAGNVYVADGTSNHIVYMNSTGTTIANIGTGFKNPTGVAVDPLGNVYISDTGNNRVVKIPFVSGAPSPGGQTTLISSITAPGQLAADRHQALYIAQGSRIYKWQPNTATMGVLAPGVISPVYTVTFTFTQATTPGEINVLTQGVAGQEYLEAEGSTCTAGTAYAVNATCTVNVTFTPEYAGVRPGAVTLATILGQPLVTAYLGGVGFAPQLVFDTQSTTQLPISSTLIGGTATNTLRGFATDASGNIYVCDEGNSRVLETNANQTQASVLANDGCASLALDGAGNVLVDTGSNVMLLPNENGAINGADQYLVASGFAGSRGMNFDGFGNVYVGDTTNIRVLVQPVGQSAATQYIPAFTGLLSSYDAAADWQGNIAMIDPTAGHIFYLPANGGAQITVGPPLCSPYAMAMDAAGSIFVTEIAAQSACTGTVSPGEDVLRITPASTGAYTEVAGSRAPEGITIDPVGNIIMTYNSTILYVHRSAAPLALSTATAPTAVGATTPALTAVISNGGPATATFTSPSGVFYLDSADFATTTSGSNSCAGSNAFVAGYSCTLSFTFDPVQAGTRTADYAPLSNSAQTDYVVLTGIAGGTTAATATTITVAVTTPASGQGSPYAPMSFTAALTGSGCSGTVSLQVDSSFVAVQPAAASVVFNLAAGLPPGFHSLSASYSGSASCLPSTSTSTLFGVAGSTKSALSFNINGSTAAFTIVQNQNPPAPATSPATAPLLFTAKLTASAGANLPTGTVRFYDGSTLLDIAPVSPLGVATFTTTGLGLGTHNITADYAGDLTYSTAISPVQAVTVVFPGDYSLTAAPSPITVKVGSVGTVTVTATPSSTALGGFYAGGIGLTCTGLPSYATCSLAPSTINLDGTGAPMTSTVSVITQALFAENQPVTASSAIRFALLPGGALFLLIGAASFSRRRKLVRATRLITLGIVLALGVLLSGITACGSHTPLATQTGSYTVLINGLGAGGINHSVSFQVTID